MSGNAFDFEELTNAEPKVSVYLLCTFVELVNNKSLRVQVTGGQQSGMRAHSPVNGAAYLDTFCLSGMHCKHNFVTDKKTAASTAQHNSGCRPAMLVQCSAAQSNGNATYYSSTRNKPSHTPVTRTA